MREVFGVVAILKPVPCPCCGKERPLELELRTVHEHAKAADDEARSEVLLVPEQPVSVADWSPAGGLRRHSHYGPPVGEYMTILPGYDDDHARIAVIMLEFWLNTQPGTDAEHAESAALDDQRVSLTETKRPF